MSIVYGNYFSFFPSQFGYNKILCYKVFTINQWAGKLKPEELQSEKDKGLTEASPKDFTHNSYEYAQNKKVRIIWKSCSS